MAKQIQEVTITIPVDLACLDQESTRRAHYLTMAGMSNDEGRAIVAIYEGLNATDTKIDARTPPKTRPVASWPDCIRYILREIVAAANQKAPTPAPKASKTPKAQ